jgi:glycosyltransferase involved in cell wall biosynthesis
MNRPPEWPSRVHFHSDCYAFSGSETTLVMLVTAVTHAGARPRFTFRRCAAYEAGLRRRLDPAVEAEPLRLPDPADVKLALTGGRRTPRDRAVRAAVSLTPLRQLCLLIDVVRLAILFRRRRPDVVHVNNGGLPGAISCNAAAIAARLAGVPVVVMVVNNLAVPYRTPSRWLDLPVDRLVTRAVTRFVTGSAAAGVALREVLHLAADRHVVIPNGVAQRSPMATPEATRAELDIAEGVQVIAVVARLEARKGHRDFLTALSQLPSHVGDGVVAVIAGDGPERDALEKFAAELGLTTRVRFVGDHPDPWSLYELADLVVLSSVDQEDLPIVLIEAMAAGRAAIATRVAGSVELIDDGVTGVLVPPRDPTRLARAMVELLGDDDRRGAMGAAGADRYRDTYTPELVVERYRALYATLAAEVGP